MKHIFLISLTSIILYSCQIPNEERSLSQVSLTKGEKIPTPHMQRQANRDARIQDKKDELASFIAALPMKILLGLLDNEREIDPITGEYDRTGQTLFGKAWRETVERPTKKASRKIFD